MKKADKMLMKVWVRSIYIDAWIAQCLNSDRQPRLSDLIYIGTLKGAFGDYTIFQDPVTGQYICEYEKRVDR